MRLPLVLVLVILAISLAVDIFIYRRLRHDRAPRGICIGYVVVAVVALATLVTLAVMPKNTGSEAHLRAIMWVLYAYLSIYVPKIIYSLFALLRMGLSKLFHRSLRWLSITGAVLAAGLFALMWWGALFNRYNIDVNEVEVEIPSLPAAFDGYRIVQLSDIHTGSFSGDTAFLGRVVDRVNALHPDVIVFTGDIVNRHSAELRPYTGVLSRLSAPAGVWSIMGNHDYGDYYRWPSPEAKASDIDSLHRMQREMGWNMLNNDYTWLHAGNDSIALIGVENIGEPPFHCYGSLKAAYPDVSDENHKILLSHNPAHWADSISGNPDCNIALTLSGHTHAMQIELLGMSPAAWRYKTWGGLYSDDNGHMLYVNIGLGEVGMPARIGATPEITLLVLKSK